MSSGLFNIALSGLLSSQTHLRTVGHNISNANTPGYSRQSTIVDTRNPQGGGNGFMGTGVDVSTIQREVNRFVEAELRVSASGLAQVDTVHQYAARIDNILADPAGGLSPSMQAFFDGLHDVAADPTSIPARQVLMSNAEGLVQRFHSLGQRLDDIRVTVEGELRSMVDDVNSIAESIARVNDAIVRATGDFTGHQPNDLLDQRDELIRDLSQLVDVATVGQRDGSLNVLVGSGQGLVTGNTHGTLSLRPGEFDPSRLEVGFSVGGVTMEISNHVRGGKIGGALEFRHQVLEGAQSALGHVALGLARTVNEQHAVGQTLTGALGGNFFSPLDQGAPAVFGHSSNTGAPAADITVTVSDVGVLPQSDYLLQRTGGSYELTRRSDGTVFTFSDFPTGAEEVDGLRFDLAAGTIADGDIFLVQPTRFAAQAISLVPTAPQGIAAAAPVRSGTSLNNLGDAVISAPSVNLASNELSLVFDTPPATFDVFDLTTGATLMSNVAYASGAPIVVNGVSTSISGAPAAGDTFSVTNTVSSADAANAGTGTIALASISAPDPNLSAPVTITFTGPGTFDVTGAVTGSPATAVSYTSGSPISFNGWTVEITGTPQTGDVFTITPNASGVGDNRNALALAKLQTTNTLDGERSTYEEVYGQLVANVGALTRQADLDTSARGALHEQIVAQREAHSGVNLDEEAANLLRFQQAYQANAQLISVADEIFASLLGAVGR